MTNLFKIVIVAAPVTAIVLYVTVQHKNVADMEMKTEMLQFDQQWSQMQKEFAASNEDKMFWDKQQTAAAEKLEAQSKKKIDLDKKMDQINDDFDAAIADANADAGGGKTGK
jgi:hypothetical protein